MIAQETHVAGMARINLESCLLMADRLLKQVVVRFGGRSASRRMMARLLSVPPRPLWSSADSGSSLTRAQADGEGLTKQEFGLR